MQRFTVKSFTLATFFSGFYLAAQPLPSRKYVYFENRRNGAPDLKPVSTGTDYESFLRTFLTVRLEQSKRLQVEARDEPPCSARAASEAVGAGAQERSQIEETSRERYFRINTKVQQRRDAVGPLGHH